jgi:acyl-CoA synthetase (AMP-forming)/AMP-acid ligase II
VLSRSFVALVLDRAAAEPGAVALVDGGREISYGELARDIEAAAARLAALGVAAGETVALELGLPFDDAYARVCRLYALNYLGATVLPLAPDEPPARRERLVREFGARAFDWSRAPGTAAAVPRADEPERRAMYRFSSGSTGEPKAVLVSNAKWAHMHEVSARALDFDAGDRLLPAIPLPHPIGVRHMVRIHAAGGALVNAQLPLDLQGLADTIRRHRVTRIVASPAQLRWLVSRGAAVPGGMPPLRGVVTGGAPLLAAEQRAVRELISPNLYIDYGAVDFSIIAVQRPGDAPETGARLVPGLEAEVVDESDRPLLFGAAGLLRVRAPWAPTAYAAPGSARNFRDGWFYPGDIAVLGPDRRILLSGRADEVINRGGVKVHPEEIEAVLRAHPQVRDAAVAGVADRIAGELPVAFVVLDDPGALQQLEAFCRERIEERRLPAGFVRVAEIPRSAEGKVLRARLRELVRAR